ncbi:hemerythrin HHE cation binding domain-containing protein [Penicillium cataractarum]|uniref:Hemerythrin HHE cation binding domain-containing protein n=1 Tax=Penicillium cataractarum TaxID=2100454 RepID=A0A9W9RZX4_9EURO|nr:hemerythrin HHE cation binding domain-containing protein [Penicillium cataractarum]KAJ5369336.1 hemerythrin HHE cation binding domain-containing protein [Penicillium cataractarum]
MAAEMSIVHNCLIRMINSVHNQCINVATRGTDADQVDFANYAFQWTEWLHEHHSSEDSTLFPSMGEIAGVPGLMDVNTNEHAGFHDKISRYANYLKEVIRGKEKLDGEKVKNLIDSFMPELHTHLENEIGTLVNLESYDKVDWEAWFKKEVGKMIKEMMGQYEYRVSSLTVNTKRREFF